MNKLLGREVYVSNLQLGGPRIMYCNGVSHIAVDNDLRGVRALLEWLSFVPERQHFPLPIIDAIDPGIITLLFVIVFLIVAVDRPVTAEPTPQPYDPRGLLNGML